MKKVVFLAGNKPSPLQTTIMDLLSETKEYDVELVYLNRLGTKHTWPMPGSLRSEKISAVSWPVGNNKVAKFLNKIVVVCLFIKGLLSKKPDVIHACSPIETLIAARLLPRWKSRPRIIYALQDTCDWMHSRLGKALQRWAFRGVETIFVTSDAFDDRFLKKLKLVGAGTEVIYVPNVPPSRVFADNRPRSTSQWLTIGWIGTFRGEEGLRSIMDGVQYARNRGADVRLLFAGAGKDVSLIEAFAEENDFVDYTGPFQYEEQIQDLYRKTDVVYALYDRSYDKKIHIPHRLCEAINCRLPILVARGTYLSELVEANGIGVSMTLGDVEELGAALVDLCRSPDKRAQISRNCEAIRKQYVFEYYKDRILAVYAPP